MEKRELDVEQLNQGLKLALEKEEAYEEGFPGRDKHHSRHSGRHSKKKRKKRKKKTTVTPFRVLVFLLCVLAVFLLAAIGMLLKGKMDLKQSKAGGETRVPEGVQAEEDGKYILYKGEKYCYNEDNINILCMGIDKSIEASEGESMGGNGQADALVLAVIDSKTGKLSLVNISRDTMVDVNKYNTEGQYLGTGNMQICLSYAYGDGREKSCQNTAESVSRLMYGVPINAYAAIDYLGISVLNDAVGGVQVEVMEDLTKADPTLEAGKTMILKGQQAHTYVRSRNTELLDSNNLRMARQKQYMSSFLKTVIDRTKTDFELPVKLYQTASEYMVTDIGISKFTYLTSLALTSDFTEADLYSVEGEVIQGETYAEFIPDEQQLFELILEVFYKKV